MPNESTTPEIIPSFDQSQSMSSKNLGDTRIGIATASKDGFGMTPLMQAIKVSDISTVKQLIDQGVDLDEKDGFHRKSALIISIESKQYDIANILIDNKANVDHMDEWGMTPLMYAAQNGNISIAEKLIRNGASINKTNDFKDKTALLIALQNQQYDFADFLLNNGADINLTDKWGMTPIMYAAQSGSLTLVKKLVENGADINKAYRNDQTPLVFARENSNADVEAFLLAKTLNQRDRNGMTPLLHAIKEGNIDLVKMLIQQGADVNIADSFNNSPLGTALEYKNHEIAQILINCDVKCDTSNTFGITPLMYAARNGDMSLVKVLVNKGADVNRACNKGKTPLVFALEYKKDKVADFFINKNIKIDSADENGTTPLMLAARHGFYKIAQKLLHKGANINHVNKKGVTPLKFAIAGGNIMIQNLILETELLDLLKCTVSSQSADLRVNEIEQKLGKSRLWIAAKHGENKIVQSLLAKGNITSEVMILDACKNGYAIPIIEMLLDATKSNIHQSNIEGETLLHIAAEAGNVELIKLLIKKGANPNLQDKKGNTPLQIALNQEKIAAAKVLKPLTKDLSTEIEEPFIKASNKNKTSAPYTPIALIGEVAKLMNEFSSNITIKIQAIKNFIGEWISTLTEHCNDPITKNTTLSPSDNFDKSIIMATEEPSPQSTFVFKTASLTPKSTKFETNLEAS